MLQHEVNECCIQDLGGMVGWDRGEERYRRAMISASSGWLVPTGMYVRLEGFRHVLAVRTRKDFDPAAVQHVLDIL